LILSEHQSQSLTSSISTYADLELGVGDVRSVTIRNNQEQIIGQCSDSDFNCPTPGSLDKRTAVVSSNLPRSWSYNIYAYPGTHSLIFTLFFNFSNFAVYAFLAIKNKYTQDHAKMEAWLLLHLFCFCFPIVIMVLFIYTFILITLNHELVRHQRALEVLGIKTRQGQKRVIAVIRAILFVSASTGTMLIPWKYAYYIKV